MPTSGLGATLHFTAVEKEVWGFVDPFKLDVYTVGEVLMCMTFKGP